MFTVAATKLTFTARTIVVLIVKIMMKTKCEYNVNLSGIHRVDHASNGGIVDVVTIDPLAAVFVLCWPYPDGWWNVTARLMQYKSNII